MLLPFDRALHGPALHRLQEEAFGIADPTMTDAWWSRSGEENIRVWVEGDTVLGGLLQIPMGAFVGGASVPLAGVAGVVVGPEARGRGVGRAMMAAAVQALEEPLCALYRSTQALYRSVGFGVGSLHHRARLALDELKGSRGPAQGWRRIEADDWDALPALYQRWNRHRTMAMDRGPYLWGRVRASRRGPAYPWCFAPDGAIEGWVVYRLEPTNGEFFRLVVVDLQAQDERALRACATFLQGHGAMCRELEIHVPPDGGVLDLLPEFRAELRLHEPCLLYVRDPAAALTLRGWDPHRSASVQLQIDGQALELRVHGGQAQITAASAGASLDRAAFASLYTGHLSATELVARGRLIADEPQRVALDSLFAGPAPSTLDFF